MVSWCCGDDEDPRKPGGPQCLHCLLPQWDKVLEEAAADQGKQLPTQQELLAHALGALPREVEVLEVQEAAGLDLQRLMQAWGVIVRNYRDHLATCCESQDEMETARSPPRLSDLANYDAVFAPSKSPEQQAADAKGDTFQIKQSPYGRGAALRLVTAQGLKRLCKPTDEGVVKIYLGVAFRSVGLVDVPPFASRKSRQHQIGKTNHRAAQLQSCGFDHVVPTDSTEELPLRIYWVPGAALPLASVSLRIHCPCSICFEQKLIEEGCRCPSGHFTCWDCFQSLLEMANQPDATRRQVDARPGP